MKERILNNWTITRVMYLVMGVALIFQSATTAQWFGVLFGSYFAAMGLFAFGCAGGACYTPPKPPKAKADIQDIYFEEVKTK